MNCGHIRPVFSPLSNFPTTNHNTVKLFCAVVGPGSVFPVDIDASETVGDLKKKIKQEKANMMRFDADLLTLYLTKHGDSWLHAASNDMKAVKRREVPDVITNLMDERMELESSRKLENRAYLGVQFVTMEEEIHILVKLPEDPDDDVGSIGSLLCSIFSLQSLWSYLQSLFAMDKTPQTKNAV